MKKNKKLVPRDMTELPVYEIICEEDGNQGIRMVSLVKDPAIEVKGMYFSNEELKKEKLFEFKNVDEKQMVVGPAMIPDRKILRRDDNDNMYYVYFTPETIKMLVSKFNKENNNKSINVDHSNRIVDGYIQQNWIVEDPTYDKSRYYGFNLPVGSWFIEIKIEDPEFWKEVKDEGKYGFSIEGLMSQELVQMSNDFNNFIDELSDDEIIQLFREVVTKNVSFDFDGTLSKPTVQQIAMQRIKEGCNVFILTKRSPDKEVYEMAKKLGIKESNVIFTSGKPKWSYILEYNIDEHYDDMIDELKEIGRKTNIKTYKV